MDLKDMGLNPKLTERLSARKITQATPVQAGAIPKALEGRDVMGLAQTGTGKTLAFGLPLLHELMKTGHKPDPKNTHALILAPTRELARQIYEALNELVQGSHLKLALVVGGTSLGRQIETLRKPVDLLVATPGRLIDLLDRKAVSLSQTRFLILDEADQMLDMGFIHALRRIAPLLPKARQTMLFSATMPKQMAEISTQYLTNPVRVEVSRPGKAADKIAQSVHFVAQSEKFGLLKELLNETDHDRALVFARTKHGAERLMKNLVKSGVSAGSIHGNKSQGQRDRAIKSFKSGDISVLVATDVAARGIDIDGVSHVYNYELPNVAENYVHRIGRTARAGREGEAIAFCAMEETGEFLAIQKLLGTNIDVASGTIWPAIKDDTIARTKPKSNRRRRYRSGGGGNGGGNDGNKGGNRNRRAA